MPPFEVTLEGKVYDVDASNEQAAAFAAHQVHSGSVKGQEPAPPTQPPTTGATAQTPPRTFSGMMEQGTMGLGRAIVTGTAQPGAPRPPAYTEEPPPYQEVPTPKQMISRGTPEAAQAMGETLKAIIPQSGTQVGAMLAIPWGAGIAAGAKLGPFGSALLRVMSGAGGGGGGAAITGEGTLKGAATGGVFAGVAEVLGGAFNLWNKWGPGATQKITAAQASEFGKSLEDVTRGSISGVRTKDNLYELANRKYGEAKTALWEFMKSRTTQASNLIGNRILNVPVLEGGTIQPGTQFTYPVQGPASFPVPASTMPKGGLTLEQASEELKNIGWTGFGGAKGVPAGRHVPGAEARSQYAEAVQQITAELDRYDPSGRATALWREGRLTHSVGVGMLDTLKLARGQGLSKGPETFFNVNAIRDVYDKQLAPRIQAYLARGQMTADEAMLLEASIYQGADFGVRQQVRFDTGPTSRFFSLLRGEGGSPTYASMMARSLLPGAGNVYPTLPPGIAQISPRQQTTADILGTMLGPRRFSQGDTLP